MTRARAVAVWVRNVVAGAVVVTLIHLVVGLIPEAGGL